MGRGYCMKHYQWMRWHGKLDVIRPRNPSKTAAERPRDLSSYVMLSACCLAPVREGKAHEYGKQHCTACGEGCLWRHHHKRDVKIS